MTAGHADGGGQLGQDVERRKDEDRLGKALEITAHAAGLYFLPGDENEHHHRPRRLGGKIRRGAPHAHQADQVGHQAGGEQGGHKGDEIVELGPHIAPHKVGSGVHQHLGYGLPLGNARHFQVVGEPKARARDERHDHPAQNDGGGDGNTPQDGDGKINRCAIDGNFHIGIIHLPFLWACTTPARACLKW